MDLSESVRRIGVEPHGCKGSLHPFDLGGTIDSGNLGGIRRAFGHQRMAILCISYVSGRIRLLELVGACMGRRQKKRPKGAFYCRWGVTPFAAKPAITDEMMSVADLVVAKKTALKEWIVSIKFPPVLKIALMTAGSFANTPKTTLPNNKQADLLSSDGFEPSTPPKTLKTQLTKYYEKCQFFVKQAERPSVTPHAIPYRAAASVQGEFFDYGASQTGEDSRAQVSLVLTLPSGFNRSCVGLEQPWN